MQQKFNQPEYETTWQT